MANQDKAFNPFAPIVFTDKDNKDVVSLTYVQKNGTFKGTISKIFGYTNTYGFTNCDVAITTEEGESFDFTIMLSALDKDTGTTVEKVGMRFIRALVGFKAKKFNASAMWTKVKDTVYGKEVEGHTLKTLVGLQVHFSSQIERSISKGKAYESNTLKRLITVDGHALKSFNEAIKAVTAGTIDNVSEYDAGDVLEKEIAKVYKYKYRKCTEQEWLDTKADAADGTEGGEDAGGMPAIPTIPSIPEIATAAATTAAESSPTTIPAIPELDDKAPETVAVASEEGLPGLPSIA